MLRKYQQGKGLFSFMAGSVAALAAIAAVLFVLDGNKSRDFKRPRLESQSRSDTVHPMMTPAQKRLHRSFSQFIVLGVQPLRSLFRGKPP